MSLAVRTIVIIAASFTLSRSVTVDGLPVGIVAFIVQQPRPYGYTIGDRLEQIVNVTVREPLRLSPGALPQTGPLDRGLELESVLVEQDDEGTQRHYRLRLTYQCFYGALAVQRLRLPAWSLKVTGGGSEISLPIAAAEFALAPLHELQLPREGLRALQRPDHGAPPLTVGLVLYVRAAIAAVLLLVSGLGLLHYYGAWWRGRPRPFARAARDLRSLMKRRDERIDNGAVQRVHRAFDETLGKPVFLGNLDEFFRARPAFEPLRAEITRFYEDSRAFFFTSAPDGAKLACNGLVDLCAHCRDREPFL